MKSNYVYLSHVLSEETPSYGNRDKFICKVNSSIIDGATANSSEWHLTNNHLGTHIDVPFHFDLLGKKLDEFRAAEWIFQNIELIDIPCSEAKLIGPNDLENINLNINTELLLIRTGYEKYRSSSLYYEANPGIHSSTADYLHENYPQIRCVGFDFISLTSWKYRNDGKLSHTKFLTPANGYSPILIIEDMSLINVKEKLELVIVSPIMIKDGNGAPVTVFGKY